MQAISLWNHNQIVSNYCPSYFYSLRNCFTFRFIQKNSFSYLMPQQEAYNVDWLVSSSVVNCLTYHMAGVIWQRSKWNQLPNIASYDFFQLQPISQTYPPPMFLWIWGIENEISNSGLTVFWQYQKSSSCSSDSQEINWIFWNKCKYIFSLVRIHKTYWMYPTLIICNFHNNCLQKNVS